MQTRHLMVSYDPRRATPALEQLPSLLAPAGFETRFAANGEEAEVLLDSWTVHVAVVDWAIPLRGEDSPGERGRRRLRATAPATGGAPSGDRGSPTHGNHPGPESDADGRAAGRRVRGFGSTAPHRAVA